MRLFAECKWSIGRAVGMGALSELQAKTFALDT